MAFLEMERMERERERERKREERNQEKDGDGKFIMGRKKRLSQACLLMFLHSYIKHFR